MISPSQLFWIKSCFFRNFLFPSLIVLFYSSKQFKKSPSIPNNLHWGSKQAICDECIRELFNENFASVFRKPVSYYIVPIVSRDSDIKLSEVDVPPSVVSSCLQSNKNTCSVDCIPLFAYKCCASLLFPLVSFPFYIIINTYVWPAA